MSTADKEAGRRLIGLPTTEDQANSKPPKKLNPQARRKHPWAAWNPGLFSQRRDHRVLRANEPSRFPPEPHELPKD